MVRALWPWMLVAMVAVGATQLSAGEGGRGGGRKVPMTMEQITQRLGADAGLTDEQKKKVEAVNEEFTKKMAEAAKKEGVAAAQADLDKAREAKDFEAIRAAYKKLTEAMGFNAFEEYKKALTPILNEAQVGKLFPTRPGRDAGEKKAEPKAEK